MHDQKKRLRPSGSQRNALEKSSVSASGDHSGQAADGLESSQQKPINAGAAELYVLHEVWLQGGISTQSNIARQYSQVVAMAACRGLITTVVGKDLYGKVWRVTPAGIEIVFEHIHD